MSKEKKKRLAFTASEVRKFFVEAESIQVRAESLLKDHYSGLNEIQSKDSVTRLHEMFLDSLAFGEMLEKCFPTTEGKSHYEIDMQSVLNLSKITAMMSVNRKALLEQSNISVETQ